MSDLETTREALERAAKTVTLRPERGQRVYRNTAKIEVGLFCHVEEGDQCLTLDMPNALGGNGAGPNPSMVLRSALSGCLAIGVKQWAALRAVTIDHIEVTIETDVDARGQLGVADDITPGFEGVRLHIAVRSSCSVDTIRDIVDEAMRYSPLIDVFARPQPLEHRISVIQSSSYRETQESI